MSKYSYLNVSIYIVWIKISNYNNHKQGNKKRSYNDFLDKDYRMLISWECNCGKTITLMHMSRKPLVYYDEMVFRTHNHHQEKLSDLFSLMNDLSRKIR